MRENSRYYGNVCLPEKQFASISTLRARKYLERQLHGEEIGRKFSVAGNINGPQKYEIGKYMNGLSF